MMRSRHNGTLVALSTRIPERLLAQLEALTPATGSSLAETVRRLLDQAVNRDAVVEFVADAIDQAFVVQRKHFAGVLRVVLLNVCHSTESEVRDAIQQLEDQGLL